MSKLEKKYRLAVVIIFIFTVSNIAYIYAQPAHPTTINTIEHGVGLYFPTVDATDYFYRGYNVTAFMEEVYEAVENGTGPVWENTVEWGLVYGTTGDWFNHDLPEEPIYIGLQMHPTNLTYDSVLVYPVVYDKDATHWQLALYWVNGTQITDNTDLMVMYHMRWEPPIDGEDVDPNEPTLPNEEPL